MAVSRTTLLVNRILQFRDISPLIVLKDTVFQSANSLLSHFEECAKSAKLKLVRIGWRRDSDVCTMEGEADQLPKVKGVDQILREISHLTSGKDRILLSIRDLNDFLASNAAHLPTFLSSLIAMAPGRICVCSIYHSDIPLVSYPTHLPTPDTLLTYLATTIISVQSLNHVLLNLDAQRRSRTSKIDLDLENRDIFTVLGSNDVISYLSLEHRRKSGRGVTETSLYNAQSHCILHTTDIKGLESSVEKETQEELGEDVLGFKIDLSDRQKIDRDGVVLPHFSAQQEATTDDHVKAQKAGTIYYEPDSGDDFDAEDPDDDLLL